jgi:hypothetical protein
MQVQVCRLAYEVVNASALKAGDDDETKDTPRVPATFLSFPPNPSSIRMEETTH